MDDYKSLIKNQILSKELFVQAIFTGWMRGQEMRWTKIIIRPVLLRDQYHLQFSYFDEKQNFTYNYQGEEAISQLDLVLELPFRNFHLHMVDETIQINLTKKGKAIIGRSTSTQPRPQNLSHDRPKQVILEEGADTLFLRAIGIMRKDGKIKSSMRSKFRQINAFVQLLADIPEIKNLSEPIHITDLGCGNAYLTFATYHYLRNVLGKELELTGIDQRADLILRNQEIAQELQWDSIHFQTGFIADYTPQVPPAIIIALHACDTATDDAIAQGIRHKSDIIVVAPCCHHELQVQLNNASAPAGLSATMRHGLWHERMGDILTDSFRALIMRVMGYQVSVLEFVSPDHTPKNILLRAIRKGEPGYRPGISEYQQLLDAWQVQPYLHKLLAEELAPYID